MESNGRKLGWLALGIGVIALFMSLVGRSATPAVNIYESGSETPYSSEAHEERSREGFAQREDGPRGFEQRFEEKRYEDTAGGIAMDITGMTILDQDPSSCFRSSCLVGCSKPSCLA